MYKVSIIVLCAAFSACLFTACRSGLQSDENSLVQVGDEILSRQELADAMPEDALIYEDETVKIYGFAGDEAMRQACGFAAFP